MRRLAQVGMALFCLMCVLGPGQGLAGDEANASQAEALDQYLGMVRGDLKARRDTAIRTLLQLSEDEAKVFWPLKDEFDSELKRILDRKVKLVHEFGQVYDKLTATQAEDLADRFFVLEEDRTALHRKWFGRFSKEVSPVIAVQFLQLQRQFETMGDLKLATTAPLATR